jgi:hypothetical protein
MEKEDEPGRKWKSGFFSMGSRRILGSGLDRLLKNYILGP